MPLNAEVVGYSGIFAFVFLIEQGIVERVVDGFCIVVVRKGVKCFFHGTIFAVWSIVSVDRGVVAERAIRRVLRLVAAYLQIVLESEILVFVR